MYVYMCIHVYTCVYICIKYICILYIKLKNLILKINNLVFIKNTKIMIAKSHYSKHPFNTEPATIPTRKHKKVLIKKKLKKMLKNVKKTNEYIEFSFN